MFTNKMRIKTELDNKVQEGLSANSLQHLQLVVDANTNGILHNIMCNMKTKSIIKSFETSGLAEVLPSASRTGFSALPRQCYDLYHQI